MLFVERWDMLRLGIRMNIRTKLLLIVTLPAIVTCVVGWYAVQVGYDGIEHQIEHQSSWRTSTVIDEINESFSDHLSYWASCVDCD